MHQAAQRLETDVHAVHTLAAALNGDALACVVRQVGLPLCRCLHAKSDDALNVLPSNAAAGFQSDSTRSAVCK